MRYPDRDPPPDFKRPQFILEPIDNLTHPEIIQDSQSHRERPLGFRVTVRQKGKVKFATEIAYYEKEDIIVFMRGLPGPEIQPTDPQPDDIPQQVVLRALNEWGKNRLFE